MYCWRSICVRFYSLLFAYYRSFRCQICCQVSTRHWVDFSAGLLEKVPRDEDEKDTYSVRTHGGNQAMLWVSESGLYRRHDWTSYR